MQKRLPSELLSPGSRLATELPEVWEAFRERNDLTYLWLDADTLSEYQAPLLKIREEAFDGTSSEHKAWLQGIQKEVGFRALVTFHNEQVVGWQATYTPAFQRLNPEVQSHLATQIHNPHLRAIVYVSSIAVSNEYQRQGIATGMWLINDEYAAGVSTDEGGGIILYRVRHGNIDAESIARSIGHMPMDLWESEYDVHAFIDMRYWLSEIQSRTSRPLESPFDDEIYSPPLSSGIRNTIL